MKFVIDAAGRAVSRAAWSGPAAGILGRAGLPRGVYHLSVRGPGVRWSRRLALLN